LMIQGNADRHDTLTFTADIKADVGRREKTIGYSVSGSEAKCAKFSAHLQKTNQSPKIMA
ncbi:MAG TPA: hypothetical protein VGM05_22375, partial [Planctomycetaceae bacterium]